MERETIVLNDYGVVLRRLTHDKIEMVRQWRNSKEIRSTMFYQDEITPEMQQNWFRKVDNDRNWYFIIEFRGEDVGVINVKDIDYEAGTGETGIFIHAQKYLGTDIAYRAHLVMFDFIFNTLGLTSTISHIRPENEKAIRFALFLGADPDESSSTEAVSVYIITADGYRNNRNRQRFIYKWNKLNPVK